MLSKYLIPGIVMFFVGFGIFHLYDMNIGLAIMVTGFCVTALAVTDLVLSRTNTVGHQDKKEPEDSFPK